MARTRSGGGGSLSKNHREKSTDDKNYADQSQQDVQGLPNAMPITGSIMAQHRRQQRSATPRMKSHGRGATPDNCVKVHLFNWLLVQNNKSGVSDS